MKQIYICSDTITGLCSALHDAWLENRDKDAEIGIKGNVQQQLFCQYKTVNETEEKAERLRRMIRRYLGCKAYSEIFYALLSDDPKKGTAVFRTLQEARNIPNSHKIMDCMGNPDVSEVSVLSRGVANEAHLYEEFIRFRELADGLLFSEITPKAQVLVCIADHFADRFPLENWIIYDKTHRIFLVHRKKKKWALVMGADMKRSAGTYISDSEKEFAELWREFFHSISIRERENPLRQRTHLPLRYRKNMTEFSGQTR